MFLRVIRNLFLAFLLLAITSAVLGHLVATAPERRSPPAAPTSEQIAWTCVRLLGLDRNDSINAQQIEDLWACSLRLRNAMTR